MAEPTRMLLSFVLLCQCVLLASTFLLSGDAHSHVRFHVTSSRFSSGEHLFRVISHLMVSHAKMSISCELVTHVKAIYINIPGLSWCRPAARDEKLGRLKTSTAFGQLLWHAEPASEGWTAEECADLAEQLVAFIAMGLGDEVSPLLIHLDGALPSSATSGMQPRVQYPVTKCIPAACIRHTHAQLVGSVLHFPH